jgi:phosphoribosylaminoimidazole-succinocarboxamide synthase
MKAGTNSSNSTSTHTNNSTGKADRDLIYRGSVKDLYRTHYGLEFAYSDRYSIFDWGEMPDQLEKKGEALALIAKTLFLDLQELGIAHHGLDLNLSGGNIMQVREVDVIRPVLTEGEGNMHWDYSAYADRNLVVGALVPLEVIFRFGVPLGSSLIERANDSAYMRELGLSSAPKPGDIFDIPVIEFSTKLEKKDRYLGYAEAQNLAGMTDSEMQRLKNLALKISINLKRIFGEVGLELWDGKVEFAFAPPAMDAVEGAGRDFLLVDSIGPDELRLVYRDLQFSKEFLRQIYNGSSWLAAVKEGKKLAAERGQSDWKKIVKEELKETPALLLPLQKEVGELIYQALADALLVRRGHAPYFDKAGQGHSNARAMIESVYAQMKSLELKH